MYAKTRRYDGMKYVHVLEIELRPAQNFTKLKLMIQKGNKTKSMRQRLVTISFRVK